MACTKRDFMGARSVYKYLASFRYLQILVLMLTAAVGLIGCQPFQSADLPKPLSSDEIGGGQDPIVERVKFEALAKARRHTKDEYLQILSSRLNIDLINSRSAHILVAEKSGVNGFTVDTEALEVNNEWLHNMWLLTQSLSTELVTRHADQIFSCNSGNGAQANLSLNNAEYLTDKARFLRDTESIGTAPELTLYRDGVVSWQFSEGQLSEPYNSLTLRLRSRFMVSVPLKFRVYVNGDLIGQNSVSQVNAFQQFRFDNLYIAPSNSLNLQVEFYNKREAGNDTLDDRSLTFSIATLSSRQGISMEDCANRIISDLHTKLFLTPADENTLQEYFAIFNQARSMGLAESIRTMLQAMLLSPELLLLPAVVQSSTLNQVALVKRLSLLLWNRAPDANLLTLARSNQLSTQQQIDNLIDQMLSDQRSVGFARGFANQWLNLERIKTIGIDLSSYSYIDYEFREFMIEEVERLIHEMVKNNRGPEFLLQSRSTFINSRLATHYNFPGVSGSEFAPFTYPASSHRKGLLGLAGILSLTSGSPVRTSPVARGYYILRRLLCAPPPPPPPGIPPLDETENPGQSLKDSFLAHRSNPSCTGCHRQMDPIGFGLEAFNPVGQFRRIYANGEAIDSSGQLPDGQSFNTASELASILSNDDQFISCFVKQLGSYISGQNVNTRAARSFVAYELKENTRIGNIIKRLVQTGVFLGEDYQW